MQNQADSNKQFRSILGNPVIDSYFKHGASTLAIDIDSSSSAAIDIDSSSDDEYVDMEQSGSQDQSGIISQVNSSYGIQLSQLDDEWMSVGNDQTQDLAPESLFYELPSFQLEDDDEWISVGNEEERANLIKYAYGERLAHTLAYQLSKKSEYNGQVIFKDENGTQRKYNYTKLYTANEPGLIGYILYPIAVTPLEIPDLKVIFRGTGCRSSVIRDLELGGGAGANSFERNKQRIIQQINSMIKSFNTMHSRENQPVNLSIAGHSLGGADAQNCLVAIMEAMANNTGLVLQGSSIVPLDYRNQLNLINDLRLFNYNSAGVPLNIAQRSISLADHLAHQKDLAAVAVNIESYNVLVVGDGVQQTGESHVLSDVSRKSAKVDVLKFDIGYKHSLKATPTLLATTAGTLAFKQGLGSICSFSAATIASATMMTGISAIQGAVSTYHSHTSLLLKEQLPKSGYQRFCNDTIAQQIRVSKVLNNKSKSLQFIQKGLNMGVNVASNTVSYLQISNR